MALSVQTLKDIGVELPPAAIEEILLDALRRVLAGPPASDPRHDLTPDEAATLRLGGLGLGPVELGADDPLLRTAAEQAALVATGLTVSQAAAKLGIDASRIRHRLGDRTIYGVRTSEGWRLPAFQFESGRLLPGLERLLPRLDPELQAVEVWRWFTAANPDLTLGPDETPVSPAEWLRAGLDPEPVARLADDL
jgi:hypothetical protein